MTGKKTIIGEKEVHNAYQTLQEYKAGKSNLENKIVEEEMFWKQKQWEVIEPKNTKKTSASAWMLNCIINKHADAMDSYPEAHVAPRAKDDEKSAETITSILPVVLERNNFEETYSDNWWYKLKHGTACYGVFWDKNESGGIGDISIRKIDLLNVFWEPGITNIQKSENIFILSLVSTDSLKEKYPNLKFTTEGEASGEIKKYIHDDNLSAKGKTLVVDWYYKKSLQGKNVLHFCKMADEQLLYSSENEGFTKGWYSDGEYPIEFDNLYPLEGMPTGFGFIELTRNSQLYIDKLDGVIMDYAMVAARPRMIVRKDSGINPDDIADVEKQIIEASGDLSEAKFRQLRLEPMNAFVMNFRENKINELKEISSNRDFAQGGTMGGVTSGAAIATLQEAGNKTSRDMIKAAYRCYQRLIYKVIERMRQFYTEERVFRINGAHGENYATFSNKSLLPQSTGMIAGEEMFREPIFDVTISAQKHTPYNTLSQNETAMNLYNAGFLNPDNANMALAVLDMMEFDGKDKLVEHIKRGQTYQKIIMDLQSEIEGLKAQNGMPSVPANEMMPQNANYGMQM
jgi:hypothetical protein